MAASIVSFPVSSTSTPKKLTVLFPLRVFDIRDRLTPNVEEYARREVLMFPASMLKLNRRRQNLEWDDIDWEFSLHREQKSGRFWILMNGAVHWKKRASWLRIITGRIRRNRAVYLCPSCGEEAMTIGYRRGSGGKEWECDHCSSGLFAKQWPLTRHA